MINRGRDLNDDEIRNYCFSAWEVLMSRGLGARSITYGSLAQRIGLSQDRLTPKERNVLQLILDRVHLYCVKMDLAPLCVLVVEAQHWAPGRHYRTLRSKESDFPGHDDVVCIDRQRVRDMDWTQVPEPTPEDFNP